MYPRLFHKGEGGKDACPFTFSLVSVDSYRIIQRRVVRRMEYKGRRSDSSLVKSRWLERDGLAGSLLLKRIYSIVLGSGFSGSSGGKESACYAGHPGLIPGLRRSLEKEMVTHSSIFVWTIPWTEEPGGLQSMGLQRARHD